jgi:hypothetical protein
VRACVCVCVCEKILVAVNSSMRRRTQAGFVKHVLNITNRNYFPVVLLSVAFNGQHHDG